jgi:D-3-phosphoglycerate dehydrogenase
MPWKILNMQDISNMPDVLDPLKPFGEVVTVAPSEAVLWQRLKEFDVYIATLEVRLSAGLIDAAPRLKVVVTPSTGWDHIDLAHLRSRGIDFLSLKEHTDFLDRITSTAEMGWALLLAVARRLPWSFDAARKGDWARNRYRGYQLSGKTMGILGYGRLGKIMARQARGFAMRTIACDVRAVAPEPGVEIVDFETLLRESDVLSVHVHMTEENVGLLGTDAFAKMKPGAFVINTSRGRVIDEAALLSALQSGRLGGAGLDVIDGEWRTDLSQHPLVAYARTHENLVISPHTGGVTYEAQRLTLAFMVEQLLQHLRTRAPAADQPARRP